MSFSSQNTPKSMSAGALPQTPLGILRHSPDPLAGFKGAASRQEGNEGEGRKGLGERGRREERGKGNGEGRGKGKCGGGE